MILGGLQKLTLLDFPENVAATVFTVGCNFRCPYCHNSGLVTSYDGQTIAKEDFFAFLDSRGNKLDGVCITGGEPLVNIEIFDFIRNIKEKGFKVKLDTNGSFPNKLKFLIENNLIDYIAMDIKNSMEKYCFTAGVNDIDLKLIAESVELIKAGSIPYEFRTTLVREFHTKEDILEISKWLKGSKNYYLQQFVDSGNLIGSGFSAFSKEETEEFASIARQYIDYVGIRGL